VSNGEISGKPGSYTYRYGQKKLYLVWWLIGVLTQILLCLPLVIKRIHWCALAVTSIFFIVIMYVVETIALYWGWWIWNEQQLWGPKVGLIPLEEFLLYFLVVPSLVTFQSIIQVIWDACQRR